MRKTSMAAAGAILSISFSIPPAQAASLSRAWISGKGSDTAGCGPIATPCRSLQYTHDNVIAAGGEIDVLDSAGYGSLSITKSLTVISNGILAGVLASAGGNGVTIAAGSTDTIYLRGLTIEGANVGLNGISFTTGASLVVDRCDIQAFTQNGILVAPPTGTNPSIVVIKTTANNNGNAGVYFNPSTDGTTQIAGLRAAIEGGSFGNNGDGVALDVQKTSSNASALDRFVSLSNTTAANNVHNGARLNDRNVGSNSTASNAGKSVLFIDAYKATGDVNSGVELNGTSGTIYLGRSLSSLNDFGYSYLNPSNNLTFYSYNDNKINADRKGDFIGVKAVSVAPK